MKRRGDDQKFLAKVLAIGTECDIALLTVEVPIRAPCLDAMPCDRLRHIPIQIILILYATHELTRTLIGGLITSVA